jgi:GT2 family glycosyltransferase
VADPPRVTAIVVTRDRPRLLAGALASAATQHAVPYETRIGDEGGSRASEVARAAGLPRVTVVATNARGAAAARNLAVAGAQGEVLAFLDDDDLWRPEHLAGLVAAFADPATTIAYRDAAVVQERVGEDGARVEIARRLIARDWDDDLMGRWGYVPPSALAVRRDLFERLGGFDESFRFSEDWDFVLRAAAAAGPPRRVPGVTVEVRLRESGNASANRGAERRACLDRLSARHRLAPIEMATFWEVAAVVDR